MCNDESSIPVRHCMPNNINLQIHIVSYKNMKLYAQIVSEYLLAQIPRDIDKSPIIVEFFNISLSIVGMLSRHKISEE